MPHPLGDLEELMSTQPEARPASGLNMGPGGILEFEKPLVRIEREIAELESVQADTQRDMSEDIRELRRRLDSMTRRTYEKLTAWETVLVARHPRRPVLRDYLDSCVKDFCELHGDRCFGDDKAIVTGFGHCSSIHAPSAPIRPCHWCTSLFGISLTHPSITFAAFA